MAREELWNGIFAENPESGFRLTADAFLLADFTPLFGGAAVCELGCGAGGLGMMLLANDTSVHLVGVEQDAAQAALAERCIDANGLCDRAKIVCADWRSLAADRFDIVVTNPPYYPDAPAETENAAARSEQNGNIRDLCRTAYALLKSGGKLCLIYRAERLVDLFCALRDHHIEPKRIAFVRHRADARCKLALVEAVRDGHPALTVEGDRILYHADGTETETCRRIYHHLKEA